MPFPFDATLKELAQSDPRGFLAAFDVVPDVPVALLNVDLSTVSAAADIVFGLGEPLQEIIHLDAQASAAEDLHRNVLFYNALLHRRYGVAVHSMVLLLRPKARHRNVDGNVRYQARPGRGRMDFGYEVIEVWEVPVETLLAGSLGTLPLAMLGKLPDESGLEAELARVVSRLVERLNLEADPGQRQKMLTSAFVLTGLRVDVVVAQELFQGARAMRESVTYQAILEEGREEGREKGRKEGREEGREEGVRTLQRTMLSLGRKKFGEPDEPTKAAIRSITRLDKLERMTDRVLDVASWRELLATP